MTKARVATWSPFDRGKFPKPAESDLQEGGYELFWFDADLFGEIASWNQLTVAPRLARLHSRLVTVDVCGPPVKLNKVSVTGLAGSADSCVPYHWSGLCVQASTEVRPRACRPGVSGVLIGRTMKERPRVTPPPAADEEWVCFSSNSLPVGATAGQIGQQ